MNLLSTLNQNHSTPLLGDRLMDVRHKYEGWCILGNMAQGDYS
jgi:hypothetical protein